MNIKRKVKKGFTLLELILAISTFAILLTTMTAGFLYISRSNDSSITSSTASFTLRNIRDYIINQDINDNTHIYYKDSNVYSLNDDQEKIAVFKDLPFTKMTFDFTNVTYESKTIHYCAIIYEIKEQTSTYKFIIKIN